MTVSDNSDNKPSVSNMINGKDKHLPSFWIPSMTPEARRSTLEKPVSCMQYFFLRLGSLFIS